MASAAAGLAEDSRDVLYTDDSQVPLEEFVFTHPLPQTVSVTRGSFMSHESMVARGDVLLLRAMAPTSVTLSYTDSDTGSKCEIVVDPDIPVKFLAQPPKESVLSEPGAEAGSGRPVSMVTYPTVADLLMDCPTYFEANSTYDDPYLPGFSVKPGDRFHYVKVVRDVGGDRMERLQCRTESGELVCLSTKCKGNFTVLRDDTPYTLHQLIELAKVPRRLKLAPDNKDLTQLAENDVAEIPDIPLSFTGVLTMSRPEDMLKVSPLNSPDTSWSISLSSNLHVRVYSEEEYEEPVKSRRIKQESLPAFVNEHEYKLPVHATLFAYTTPPEIISQCLKDSRDIIVHECLHTQKLFVKDSKKDEYFAIDESVNISFVEIPRMLSSIFEMMSLPLGSQVQVLADIAGDFPEPFVLRYGDVLRVTKHESSSWKFKHSSTGDVPIVKCERVEHSRKNRKLKLPLDLDVNLVLMSDHSQLRVTKVADIFSGEEDIPASYVSVLEGKGGSYPPLPVSLQVLKLLPESELLISSLGATGAISPLIKTCVRIPIRHQVQLGLKRKLEFPDGYFIMPSKRHVVAQGIERVEEREYEELVQSKKLATEYEDVEFTYVEKEDDTRSQASSSGRSRHAVHLSSESIPRSVSSACSGTLERKRRKNRARRISEVLNPKNWRLNRAAATNQEELPPPLPPVSGILTLSLQPSQAMDNVYMEDVEGDSEGKDQSKHQAQGADAAYFEDDTYEDVNISHGSPARSGSLPLEHTEQCANLSTKTGHHLSSSTNDINKHAVHQESNTSHHKGKTGRSSSATRADRTRLSPDGGRSDQPPHRHNREENSEESSRGGRHRRRKTESCVNMSSEKERPRKTLSPDCERKSRERSKDDELSTNDLEMAPPVRHTRTRSPESHASASERTRRTPSSDVAGGKSHKQPSFVPGTPEKSEKLRKAQFATHERQRTAHNNESEKHDRGYNISVLDKKSDKFRKNNDSVSPTPPERHGRIRSPDTSSDVRGTPERRRKAQSSDSPGKSNSKPAEQSSVEFQTELSNSPKRTRKTRSPGSSEQDRAERTKTSPSSDRSSSEQSPRRLEKPQEGKSSESHSRQRTKQSPDSESNQKLNKQKKPLFERNLDSGEPCEEETPRKSKGEEDSVDPIRPRRPRRKLDASGETTVDSSADPLDTDSRKTNNSPSQTSHKDSPRTAGSTASKDSAVHQKPAVPPKPVISPDKRRPPSDKPATRPKPVAPPRNRGIRIGSTEAEMFSEGAALKPVLGRRRTP